MAQALNYDPTRRYDVQTRDVEYRRDGSRSWLAMIYQPQGPGPFPAVLDIHGGAWNNGTRTDNPAIVCAWMCPQWLTLSPTCSRETSKFFGDRWNGTAAPQCMSMTRTASTSNFGWRLPQQ